ncbi:unnamed protein product [Fusarium venenatum]|uniref:Uncharacterized protein n=2 Tax=Fusarium venenatum TaxID=56646 RepID=A0A2L2TL66_9HYPO|nr:uncharacterized protein FVRRES_02773 [Fusarium venenatum]CEI66261.1 unnamed protein product [Fusarium venenatum]
MASDLSLWIIDNNSTWFEGSVEEDRTVYRDCEGEYVELSWEVCKPGCVEVSKEDILRSLEDKEPKFLTAFDFLHDVSLFNGDELGGRLYDDNYRYRYYDSESDKEVPNFELKDWARVLVRRDNMVEMSTWRTQHDTWWYQD